MNATSNTNTNTQQVDFKSLLPPKLSFADKIALKRKAEQEAKVSDVGIALTPAVNVDTNATDIAAIALTDPKATLGTFSLDIKLNAKQYLAGEFAGAGKSFVYTGKAGTGKTTGEREIARSLLLTGRLQTHSFNSGGGVGPSIAFCAYTNRATDNMRRALHKDPWLEAQLPYNVLTIHKLLEYTVEWLVNAETGKQYPHFYPKRCAANPLDITHLIIEEGSQVDIPLWKQVFEALKPGTVIIIVGDINQLPPVFGPSVFNYALVQLPIIELDEVYRQAADSPILSNAHRALNSESLQPDGHFFKLFQSKPGSKLLSENGMCAVTVNSLKKWMNDGNYDPMTDIILSPINKDTHACGTKNINYHMAQYLGDKRGAKVHQVLAGRNKLYLAEGDRVMVEKQDGVISKISMNASYIGKTPMSVVCDVNRFGQAVINNEEHGHIDDDDFELTGYENLDVDIIPDEEKKLAASHMVDVLLDTGETVTLESAGDFSDAKFNLGYALSVHKAQGSEWRKVVFIMHKNFRNMLYRELIYTAMTRAREYLSIIDLTNCLDHSLKQQRIKGNSIAEKIEWFNSKLTMTEPVQIVP